jgi:hypothetical protein
MRVILLSAIVVLAGYPQSPSPAEPWNQRSAEQEARITPSEPAPLQFPEPTRVGEGITRLVFLLAFACMCLGFFGPISFAQPSADALVRWVWVWWGLGILLAVAFFPLVFLLYPRLVGSRVGRTLRLYAVRTGPRYWHVSLVTGVWMGVGCCAICLVIAFVPASRVAGGPFDATRNVIGALATLPPFSIFGWVSWRRWRDQRGRPRWRTDN